MINEKGGGKEKGWKWGGGASWEGGFARACRLVMCGGILKFFGKMDGYVGGIVYLCSGKGT